MAQVSIDQALEIAFGLHEAGRTGDAEAIYRQILIYYPDQASAWHRMGLRACEAGHLHVAIELIERAIGINSAVVAMHSDLGEVFRRAGQSERAVASLHRALALQPDAAEVHNNLGNALSDKGSLDEAIAAYRQALAVRPDFAPAHSNLGVAFKGKGWLDEAIAAFRRAAELNPDLAEVHFNLGSTLLAWGDCEEANRAYRRALTLRPGYVAVHSNLLTCEQYQTGVSPSGLAHAHTEWDERHAASYRAEWKPWDLDRDAERPLRLGFVSPDLYRHPVGFFLVRALENLNRQAFTVVCYHTGRKRDDLSNRIAGAASESRDAAGLDDGSLAARIRADRIDILFDLSGHTIDNRMLVFARRPAPVQITWIGYVGTTGLAAIDYLITDRFHTPPGTEVHYRETLLRMPDGYVCYDPPAGAPPVGPLPALERGHVTFGSFNNVTKITPEVMAVWAEIVRQVPRSRLRLVSPALSGAGARERTCAQFVAAGGDRDRLELDGAMAWHELLAAYNTLDLALDPFPYSGGLTTCEALWMGVPVVTCPGQTFAGRHSLSHLSNVGLTETVAVDLHDYVNISVRLAADLPRLATIRAGLRERVACSPLCDGSRFAAHLARHLRAVWRRWCRS